MALRPEFSLGHSEFNDFLFAIVGEEDNGTPLTVLSALTRLDLDPWAEAARLSDLPPDKASRALAVAIALLPAGDWQVSDAPAIAGRLVESLPKRRAPMASPPPVRAPRPKMKPATMVLLVAALAAVSLFGLSFVGADRASPPGQSTVLPPRR